MSWAQALLRVRILFWPEEPWRNLGQKNDMSSLPSQDSGIPRRAGYQGGDSWDGDPWGNYYSSWA